MTTTQQYLDLITSEHKDKPNFTAMVALDVSPMVQVQNLMSAMIPLFDIDVAVGQQLDVIGQWAGVSRNVKIPISGVYFSWDSGHDLGWDFGVWRDPLNPTTITVLPDSAYRTLIRARIAANQWDGTTDGAYAIWASVFPDTNILIQDHQDMSYDLILVGTTIDSLTIALLTGGYIPLRPEGVLIANYYVPVDASPIFGWDIENTYLAGWEEGTWAVNITV